MSNKVSVSSIIKKQKLRDYDFYSIRSLIGNDWAMWYFILGGRDAGKSYAVTDLYCRQYKKYGRPFTWLRLTEDSAKKLLKNNAEKLVDPDLKRKYELDLMTIGTDVYNITKKDEKGKVIKKELMARVLALSTFYSDKGSALYDKDFLLNKNMYYNIALDEMNREKSERNTFDISYAFVNQIENLIRDEKNRVRIICIGNTLEEASDILCTLNFIPQEFGRFKLKSKRAIVDYVEPSKTYLARRKGTAADLLMGNASTFTNKIDVDTTLITKKQLVKPEYIIKFFNDEMFTVWDSNVVCVYNKERVRVIAMRPYQDLVFNVQLRDSIIALFDNRQFLFRNLITQKKFKKALEMLKPRKNG